MPIQFQCPECQRLLRVDESAAGKQAKCPACSTVVAVPEATPGGLDETTVAPPEANYDDSAKQDRASGPGVPPPDPHNPYASPASSAFPAEYEPREPIAGVRPTVMNLGDVFARTWTIFQKHMAMCIAVVVTCGVLTVLFSVIGNAALGVLQGIGAAEELIILLNGSFSIVDYIFQIWIGVGETMFLVQTARGERPRFSTIFTGAPRVLPVILYSILMGLIFVGLMAAAGIPTGIVYLISQDATVATVAGVVLFGTAAAVMAYIGLMFVQGYYLIIDRQMGVMESFPASREVMRGNKLSYFGLMILAGLIAVAGVLAFCVGFIFTATYATMLPAVAYLVVTGQPIDDEPVASPA